MKTAAEEYFEKEYGSDHIQGCIDMNDTVSIFGLMDEFANYKAKQVAQKALEDASERVKYNVSDFYCDCGQSYAHWTVDKQSILSTPLIIE